MAVHYMQLNFASRDHEHVSREQYVLLHDIYYGHNGPALKAFNVNEGHRTMARQAELVREQGRYNAVTNPHGAAEPSATAPHIKSGHPDHALDLDGVDAFIAAAAHRGVTYRKTVSTESWHVEPDPAQLARYYNANKARVLGIGSRKELHYKMRGEDVRQAKVKLRAVGLLKTHGKSLAKGAKDAAYFGPSVRKAVNVLKKSTHRPQDGKLGPAARKALDKLYAKRKTAKK